MTHAVDRIVAKVLEVPVGAVTDDLSRQTSGEWTSLRHLELMAGIQDEYGFRLEPREIRSIRSVRDIRAAVDRHIAGG